MFEQYSLSKWPSYGKTFVAVFALLIIGIVLWMFILGAMESKMFCSGPTYDEYGVVPEKEAMEPLFEESELVTPPDWTDSGEQKVITKGDADDFRNLDDYGELEPNVSFWNQFSANMGWSIEHFASESMLFFAVGFLFLFTGYSTKTKRFLIVWTGVLIVLHAFGTAGFGFCWPSDFLMYGIGPLLLLTLLLMAVMILKDLGRKS